MQGILEKAYNGFLGAIDGFANCSSGTAPQPQQAKTSLPVATPDYAYPCDNYIDSVLGNKLVRQTLRTIANKYYGQQLEDIVQDATELTSLNYPNLYANYHFCCTTLNVTNPPKVFATSRLSGINALSVEVEKESIILMSYMSVIGLNNPEQRFLLGHEMGHIQLGHMVAHTVQGLLQNLNTRAELLGPIVTDLIDVPLNRWYRTSEFTADRAGYLCCKDLKAIRQLFEKLDQDAPVNAFEQYQALSDAYPSMKERLDELTYYSRAIE